jgi:predicted phage tail protein
MESKPRDTIIASVITGIVAIVAVLVNQSFNNEKSRAIEQAAAAKEILIQIQTEKAELQKNFAQVLASQDFDRREIKELRLSLESAQEKERKLAKRNTSLKQDVARIYQILNAEDPAVTKARSVLADVQRRRQQFQQGAEIGDRITGSDSSIWANILTAPQELTAFKDLASTSFGVVQGRIENASAIALEALSSELSLLPSFQRENQQTPPDSKTQVPSPHPTGPSNNRNIPRRKSSLQKQNLSSPLARAGIN